jgi:hypothetical protein
MGEEPFKARWGGMNMNTKTLGDWLSTARKSFDHAGRRPVQKIR